MSSTRDKVELQASSVACTPPPVNPIVHNSKFIQSRRHSKALTAVSTPIKPTDQPTLNPNQSASRTEIASCQSHVGQKQIPESTDTASHSSHIGQDVSLRLHHSQPQAICPFLDDDQTVQSGRTQLIPNPLPNLEILLSKNLHTASGFSSKTFMD